MAGLCGLKILLLCAGIIGLANSTTAPQPSQCSYTVTPIKFGFKIDITSVTTGTYAININEEGRPETVKKSNVQHSNQTSSHEINHLEPCTEYEHNVVFIDSAGNKTYCTHPENKTETTGMSKDDIKEVSCTPGYVCYWSEWDISSSLADTIPAEPCTSDNKTFCIKPGYDDICSELTTTFTSRHCVNSSFSLTKDISVDFLNPSEINQTIPKGLPAEIEPTLPPNCKDLTIDYTCQEQQTKLNEPKKLSELEPFTDYSCVGQIKNNNVTINKTIAVEVRIDCDLTIDVTKKRVTNTSIDLSWTTTSQNCRDVLPDLQKLSYDCSCRPAHKQKPSINQHPQGRTCHIAGLEPFTDYTCEVHPTYNNKKVDQKTEVRVKTDIGTPEEISGLTMTVPEHNVIKVTCSEVNPCNGPRCDYKARLYGGSVTLEKINKTKCYFEFNDLSYSTTYTVEVTAFNSRFESKAKSTKADTLYNGKALIGCLVFILITFVVLAVVIYFLKCRNGVNEDKMLESTAIYAYERPPGWCRKEAH